MIATIAAPARAGAVGAQGDGVAAVRHQVGRLDRRHPRRHFAEHAGRALELQARDQAGRRLAQRRHLARRALVQERRHRLDARIAHAPVARHAVEEDVGDRDDAHPLVVRHEGADAGDAFRARLAPGRVVERLDEAVAAARARLLEAAQVGRGTMRRDLGRERGRVRRDDELVVRRAAQRQARHALGRVLVGEGVVAAGVRGLRDAPRHVVVARERDVLEHGGVRGAVQDAAVRLVEDERRHQVFEHRPRPRAQAGERADGVERAAERDPVRRGNVALGDRPQAGRARFRGEQVVEAAVELVLGDAKADVEEAPLAMEEEGEVGLGGDRAAGRAMRCRRAATASSPRPLVASRSAERKVARWSSTAQASRCAGVGIASSRGGGALAASSAAAAVEQRLEARRIGLDSFERRGAAEHVGERFAAERLRSPAARSKAIRVAEAARARRRAVVASGSRLSARHAWASASRWVHRLPLSTVETYCGDSAWAERESYQFRKWPRWRGSLARVASVASTRSIISTRADPAEALRARGGEQVEADVGGRGPVRDHVARHDLQVVGRQVVVLGADDALEQAPGVARDVVEQGAVVGRERAAALDRSRPAHPPRPQRRHRPDQAKQRRRRGVGRAGRHQREPSAAAATGAPQCLRTRTRRSVVAAASAAAAVLHSSRWRLLTNWR